MMELQGRTALVTGSGRRGGIGAATARLFAREGAEVIVVGREPEPCRQVVEDIGADGGSARFAVADLGSLEDVERLVEEAGDVEVLVNNAATYRAISLPALEQSVEANDESWDTNVRAAFVLGTGLARGMIERRRGSIVNISSIAAFRPYVVTGATYSAQKAALDSFTKAWAAEWGPSNVRVNSVAPGAVQTEAVVDHLGADNFAANAEGLPLRRSATPEEMAEIILFFAGDRSRFVTGQTLVADGGQLLV